MPDRLRGHMLILDSDSDLLPELPNLKLPTLDPHSYPLLDDDAKQCRIISEDELDESYVDTNIDTFQIKGVNWLTLDVDNQYVTITYNSGDRVEIQLGSIDYSGSTKVEQYMKRNNIIYPIDDSGILKLDATNTPQLVAIRTWYYNEAKRVNDERIEIAEVVHAFSEAIGELGNTAEHVAHP